jgi:RNA polymerase sigma-70 factor (ECF subfamily)
LSGVIETQREAVAAEVLERVQARVEAKTWQAFYQTAMEQRPAADVAGALGLNVGAVYKCRFRVKQMLIEEYTNVRPAR